MRHRLNHTESQKCDWNATTVVRGISACLQYVWNFRWEIIFFKKKFPSDNSRSGRFSCKKVGTKGKEGERKREDSERKERGEIGDGA